MSKFLRWLFWRAVYCCWPTPLRPKSIYRSGLRHGNSLLYHFGDHCRAEMIHPQMRNDTSRPY